MGEESSNIKYLSDGRKVAIVGKLNSKETIVQEVFVKNDGSEIPSGENFVIKSFHDEPVISYREKEAQKTEEKIRELKAKRERHDKEAREAYEKLQGVKEVVRQSKRMVELLDSRQLDVFAAFVTGTIEYLVIDGYSIEPPVRLIDQVIKYKRTSYSGTNIYDSIRLMSVMGRSNGELEYRLYQYSDQSGSSSSVYPFATKKDALAKIKEIAEDKIGKGYFTDKDWEKCKEMGIKLSPKCEKIYFDKVKRALSSNIDTAEKELNERKETLSKMKKRLKSIKQRNR